MHFIVHVARFVADAANSLDYTVPVQRALGDEGFMTGTVMARG